MSAAATPARGLRIDVASDLVCPWCWIGKKHLDDALAAWRQRHPDAPAPTVVWHPFQLNPDMPEAGMARDEYLASKFGDSQGGVGYDQVRAAASAAGLPFRPERIGRQPNTLAGHVLMAFAAAADAQHAMAERLFRAYFDQGADLGDRSVLLAVAEACGLPRDQAAAAMDDGTLRAATLAAEAGLRKAGIAGVPFFVINRRTVVNGAQGAAKLYDAIVSTTGS